MTYFIRLALLLAGLSAIPLPILHSRHPSGRALSPADRRVAFVATARAAHQRLATIHWLEQQRVVRLVRVAAGAIDIRFKDGAELFILPRLDGRRRPERSTVQLHTMIRMRQTAGTPRALVLEPFANELGLGADAGQQEADILTKAGFSVDIVRNSAVTVQVMETLNSYSVVYMETHSDPLSAGGDAVVATGEVDTGGDAGLFADGSLRQVTVAGDTGHIYDAITGAFITQHLGNFPNSSIMFVNGCGVRNAPLFWNALQSRNLAALIGWDNDVPSSLNVEAGHFVMTELANSATVAGTIATATEEGLAIGVTATGSTARLGFVGDGFDTLASARAGAPAPSMPPATMTPSPAPTVVPTRATATPPQVAATPRPAIATVRPAATAHPAATARPTSTHRGCRPGHHRVHGRCRLITSTHPSPTKPAADPSWPGEFGSGGPARAL